MDFFGAQEAAKKRTFWAIILFALGVVATALTLYAAVIWILYSRSTQLSWDLPVRWAFSYPKVFLWSIVGVVGVILGASTFKIMSLSEGGIHIANSVGARLLDPNTIDESERRLLNVVEEMALASGYGMPNVGILDDEQNINAFAAAVNPRDAVVVVTRGALDNLTRDELQAVIGHEFSHLLNGDSHMNITLTGWIFGLFFVTIIGRMFMQVRGRKSGGIVVLGLAIFIIGLVGYFFGRIIQALISRQREFLADASSVQFTRNPPAMVSTLNKLRAGSTIQHHSSSGIAHFFFGASSILDNFAGILSTHPALEARMKAIDTNYENNLNAETFSPAPVETPPEELSQSASISSAEAIDPTNVGGIASPLSLVGLIAAAGSIQRQAIHQFSTTVESFPAEIKNALTSPEGAQAILLGLALPTDNRQECLMSLQKENRVSTAIFRPLYELDGLIEKIDIKHRLLIAQMAAGRVRNIPEADRVNLSMALEAIVAFDGKLSAFEALYTEFIRHALGLQSDSKEVPPAEAASRVLSFLYAQQSGAAPISTEALAPILEGLTLPAEDIRPLKFIPTVALREALPALLGFGFIQRRELLIAIGRVLNLDNQVTDEEAELLRLLAGLMDCPIPVRE